MTLLEKYPDIKLPVTRANIKKIIDTNSLGYILHKFKSFGTVDENALIFMKDVSEWEFRKHFIGLGTNKCVFQAIATSLPNVDLESDVARNLRTYLNNRFADWKFELLNERLYVRYFNILILVYYY